jgi:hypothetical protein
MIMKIMSLLLGGIVPAGIVYRMKCLSLSFGVIKRTSNVASNLSPKGSSTIERGINIVDYKTKLLKLVSSTAIQFSDDQYLVEASTIKEVETFLKS